MGGSQPQGVETLQCAQCTGRRGGGVWRDDDATDGQRALIYTLYSGMQFHLLDLFAQGG